MGGLQFNTVLGGHFFHVVNATDTGGITLDILLQFRWAHPAGIEQAGIHSGDSACSLPPYSLPKSLQDELAALIWIDIDPEIGVMRVIARDGYQVEDEMKKWLGTQQEYFSQHSTREKADFILTT